MSKPAGVGVCGPEEMIEPSVRCLRASSGPCDLRAGLLGSELPALPPELWGVSPSIPFAQCLRFSALQSSAREGERRTVIPPSEDVTPQDPFAPVPTRSFWADENHSPPILYGGWGRLVTGFPAIEGHWEDNQKWASRETLSADCGVWRQASHRIPGHSFHAFPISSHCPWNKWAWGKWMRPQSTQSRLRGTMRGAA